MKRLADRITNRLKRFLRIESGIMAAEVVLVLPVFLFCTVGMYSYYDAFKSLNSSQKATFTVSDMIARTMQPVNMTFINGLQSTMQYLVGPQLPVKMRVSSVTWSALRNRYEVKWSRSPSFALPQLTTTTVQNYTQHIPLLADGDTVIIVETDTQFTPVFARMDRAFSYTEAQDFKQFVVTRPRFVPQVCLDGVVCE